MKNLNGDRLNDLPSWARNELVAAPGDLHDYFDSLVVVTQMYERTHMAFDNAGVYVAKTMPNRRIILTQNTGYHVFLITAELQVHQLAYVSDPTGVRKGR